ncbi:Protein sel-1-like [Gracilariopsis chorda]|uniref:Protein sel-1-like n=1 Tax=Gracilariopsis chorda TaxID=448386 RepID=A0A2V3J104_9FLOR|nr:Protein sel-1-like [Gracilariopsis chorda]|eukprot:PXF48081.1 Protein sel-1-like [Gracilariopsis chorda]
MFLLYSRSKLFTPVVRRAWLVSRTFPVRKLPNVGSDKIVLSNFSLTPTKPDAFEFHDQNSSAQEAERLLTEPNASDSFEGRAGRALELLQVAVSQDSPRAKTLLGSMFREGLIVEQDRAKAERLFEEAAAEGDPVAQCSLGALQLDVLKQEKAAEIRDKVTHTEFAVDVDDKGEIRGRLQMEVEGLPMTDAPKPAELVRRVRKARRKAGFTDQESREYEEFVRREREGQLVEKRRIAMSWLEKAAEHGNDEAMVILGNEVLDDDPDRAIELYESAIRSGHNTDAYYNLGQIYTKGHGSVQPDPKIALKNFAMAAQLGDPSAQFYLGHLYRVGSREVGVDAASSRQYIELAAAQDHPGALYYLALMHRNGEAGLEKSDGAFLRYVREAANRDHGPAHICLAELYYTGSNGEEVDYTKALKHFLEAGRLGEAEALCSAAAMHFHGFGTPEEQHEAFLLYQRAAELGSVQALRNIGSMYFHGQGIPANKKLSEYFFRVAEERDSDNQKRDEIHLQTPVEKTDAPKHPMADIPRPDKEAEESTIVDDIAKHTTS